MNRIRRNVLLSQSPDGARWHGRLAAFLACERRQFARMLGVRSVSDSCAKAQPPDASGGRATR